MVNHEPAMAAPAEVPIWCDAAKAEHVISKKMQINVRAAQPSVADPRSRARRLRRQASSAAPAPPPPAVTVATPVQRTIVDQDEYVGRFVAVDVVEVRARVSGYLDEVHFNDGQIVKQGDLLFTIDKRPFQNALDQARANLDAGASPIWPSPRPTSRAASSWCATRPSPSRSSSSARRPSAMPRPRSRRTRRRCARPSSISSSPSCARR